MRFEREMSSPWSSFSIDIRIIILYVHSFISHSCSNMLHFVFLNYSIYIYIYIRIKEHPFLIKSGLIGWQSFP